MTNITVTVPAKKPGRSVNDLFVGDPNWICISDQH